MTLQQSVQVPQARVGASPASAAMVWGGGAVMDLCRAEAVLTQIAIW
jgi:hypothetical protein